MARGVKQTPEEKAERYEANLKALRDRYANDAEFRKQKAERYQAKKEAIKAYNNKRYHQQKAELQKLKAQLNQNQT
jgi:hypothetical protein